MGRYITALLVLALTLAGCGKSVITTLDKAGNPVTIANRIGGRGCIAITVDPASGSVDAVLQQDATSDWAGIRAMPIMLQTALATLFGNRDPAGGDTSFSGPSAIGGCDGIFEFTDEPEIAPEPLPE